MSTNFSNDAATGYVSADGFAGVQSGNPNSPTYAAATFPSGLTVPSATTLPSPTITGFVKEVAQVLAAAGATQGNAGVITGGTVIVTVTASTEGVKLPTAATGRQVQVFVPGTVGVKVYPNTNGKIDASSTNTAVLLVAGKANLYFARDTTRWVTMRGA